MLNVHLIIIFLYIEYIM